MTTDELDLVPTDELCEALKRRTEAGLLATASKCKQDGQENIVVSFWGGWVRALGIATHVKHHLVADEGEPDD